MAMQHTEAPFREGRRSSMMTDAETWLGNALATILAGAGIACGVIGLLVAFEYISTSVNTAFQDGMVWMVGGLVLAISATVFRREHHIIR
jgi:hypothetical protein